MLEGHGILRLPPKQDDSVRDIKDADRPAWNPTSDSRMDIRIYPADTRPFRTEPVTGMEDRKIWNAA